MKKIYTIILVATLGFFFTGCDHYLDVNKNVDAPDEKQVMDYHYLPGIEMYMGNLYLDIRGIGSLSQMMGTNSSYWTPFANNYAYNTADRCGEMWRVTYWLQGKNLENMINYAVENERWTIAGIGYVLKAHSWDVSTKEYGDMPCQQAFEEERVSHDYDYQPLIYDSIRTWALRGIEYLERTDETYYGNVLKEYDPVFLGNKDKWIKVGHGVICRNLASLTRKSDFVAKYANDLIAHGKLAMQSNDDNFLIPTLGGGAAARYNSYNNFWGVHRGNLSLTHYQSDYIVKIMTGTVPLYDHSTGDIVKTEKEDHMSEYYPYQLNPNQIICDTNFDVVGHFDPRIAAKLAPRDAEWKEKDINGKDSTVKRKPNFYISIDNEDSVKHARRYYGGSLFNSREGYQGWNAPSVYGRNDYGNTNIDGDGRWIFSNDAPVIAMTAGEIQFEMAEAYWYMGDKANALACWKKGVELDMDFTSRYLVPGIPKTEKNKKGEDQYVTGGAKPGGDFITKSLFNKLAQEYLNGPFVGEITTSTLTLSHIMMQKYVHLWPWGAYEAWVDLRKYHYDIEYSGDYPYIGNGFDKNGVNQKWDEDKTKVYKGFYLGPARVEGRKGSYTADNEGSPAYRLAPRYNSEFMWNRPALAALKPIPGLVPDGNSSTGLSYKNYHISIPWFAYPGDYPESLPY
jgi:hypothetical protein